MKLDSKNIKVLTKYAGAIFLSLLLWFKDEVVSTFQSGVSIEKKEEVKSIVNDPEVIRSIFENKETLKQVAIIKKAGEDEIIKRDAAKVGLRVLLSKEMNVFEDNVPKEVGRSVLFYKFLSTKLDSIINYRINEKVDPLIKNRINLRSV